MRDDLLNRPLTDPEDREQVRGFLLTAIDPATDVHVHYRAYRWNIEDDVIAKLGAFNSNSDPHYELALHDLKLLRRFLLQRYSFGNVLRIDGILRNSGVSSLWLFKDYLVPRIALSLLVGFGITLGSSKIFDSLREMAALKWPAVALALIACLLTFLLIYLSVRERLGGGDQALAPRTFAISIIAVAWAAFELLIIYGLSLKMRAIYPFTWAFNWWFAAEVGALALLFAILTQFFFTKAGSMAEPL
jgi:hypothetical protein